MELLALTFFFFFLNSVMCVKGQVKPPKIHLKHQIYVSACMKTACVTWFLLFDNNVANQLCVDFEERRGKKKDYSPTLPHDC